jgi:arylsulfatase
VTRGVARAAPRLFRKGPLKPGKHVLTFGFKSDGGVGRGVEATLAVDGKSIGSKRFARTIGYRMSLDETLDIGQDRGMPVSEDYRVPYRSRGNMERVTVTLKK